MHRDPELSLILTTFERPDHLERSLASLAMQTGVDGRFEVIVADDGSCDHTHELVERFARQAPFRLLLTTHRHDGFRVAQSRNEGVRASRAPYLLFSDGDCVFPRDHLLKHLCARRPGVVRAGNCYRLDKDASTRIDLAAIRSEAYREAVPRSERRRLFRRWMNDCYFQMIGHRTKPKLSSSNFSMWRCDYEAVNGFDEAFVGWGCEDDDLGIRLRKVGVRIMSILAYTQAYHLWHRRDATCPAAWSEGANVQRLRDKARPVRCQQGLEKEFRAASLAGSVPGFDFVRERTARPLPWAA